MPLTVQGLFLITLIVLALGLMVVSSKYKMLPLAIGASIAWLVLAIAFVTGTIGSGFTVLWVQIVSILFVLLAFIPLIGQMKQEVKNEVQHRGRTSSWITHELGGWDPFKTSTYDSYREKVREVVVRSTKRRRSRRRIHKSGTW